MWFGTTGEGVYRFDGTSFTQFTVDNGLNNNTVWAITEDDKGRIWFGTDTGLSRLDGKAISSINISISSSGSTHAPHQTEKSAQPAVWSLHQDRKGTLWIGSANGMLRFRNEVMSAFLPDARVQNPNRLHLRMVDDIHEDKKGNIWFASGMPPGQEGLCRFDGKTVKQFKPGGETWIRSVIEDHRGVLWLGMRHLGTWRYDGKLFSSFQKHAELGSPLLIDRSGSIWFAGEERENGLESANGIWRYDGKSFKNYSVKEGMGKYTVWSIVEDRTGNIWIGTRNMELYRYDGKSFKCFSKQTISPYPVH